VERFANKLAVVTGAASGIGACVAERLAAEGAQVVALDRAPGRATACIHPLVFDVADAAAWQSLGARLPADRGAPQLFIHCAGILETGDIEALDHAAFQRALAVNAGGVFLGCQWAVRSLRASALPGAIVNVVSTAAQRTAPWVVAYGASKAAALSVTRAVALHCAQARLPVRCNAVLPGVTMTPMVQRMIDAAPDPAAATAALEAQHPLGRMLAAAEIAEAILYLASAAASGITGAALAVDGGLTAA
jgi:NAD(P)-dependent dehydrogenase (short-subunit alcohol dehydrogenase family)